MGRFFDGTNDRIDFGSDSSIDDFVDKTIAMWFRDDAGGGATHSIFGKASNAEWQCGRNTITLSAFFGHGFSGTDGLWTSTFAFTVGQWVHMIWTYNNSATTNVPTLDIDGTSQTIVTTTTPTGTADPDAAISLRAGENKADANDLSGAIVGLCYDNTIWDAAQCNRHRWWGRPGGAIKVIQPWWTESLGNEGSAVAPGTATGTTVGDAIVPLVRPGSAMMGLGVGW